MASLLAPVAYGLLPAFLSLTDLLGRQWRSAGLLILGLGSRGGVTRGLSGGILPESRDQFLFVI